MSCGVTNTLYGNQVAPAIMKEYGGQLGGCGCMGSQQVSTRPRKNNGLIGGGDGLGGTCSGQPTMLRALGIMQGGRRQTRRSTRKQRGGNCGTCRLYRGGRRNGRRCKPGAYKPTAADKTRLARHLAGKSIGFTQRSSLKAKGLLRRANGTCKVSRKYQ